VQGLFPLSLCSSSCPRATCRATCCARAGFTRCHLEPISYLIEAFRSLYIYGWDGTALWRGFAVAIGLTVIALFGWRARCG